MFILSLNEKYKIADVINKIIKNTNIKCLILFILKNEPFFIFRFIFIISLWILKNRLWLLLL